MTDNDSIGLVIVSAVGLAIVVIAICLLKGKGSFLIAGYNTMATTEKEKYDTKALCRFLGKIMLPIGIFAPIIVIGGIYEISWMPMAYALGVIALAIFATIYCNTGNRFRE